ncbi:MAG: AAA family ATPase [Thiotrichales bacterium]|nr:AAA family ATPase [Thiotrichales bacterium]
MDLITLIDQLSASDLYPHPVEVITTIETHISIVFLTGQFAYKLKKPVNFGFLDFSTLEQRKNFCRLELALNKRTAPEIYLEVVPLYAHHDRLSFTQSNDSEPVEYLVKMNQFDPNYVLGRFLRENTLEFEQIENLATQISNFHQQAEACPTDLIYGHPDDAVHPMLENFPSLIQTFEHPEVRYRLTQLAQWTHFKQKQLYPLLERRKQDGFVKACHGDMHLDNITLINEKPVLFDGIEFNDQFRWIDTINDLAFLLIDLDYRQQTALRRQLLSLYMNQTSDYKALELLRFYQTYRAMVRAKITALRYHQLDKNSREAEDCWQMALDYIKQAEGYAYDVPETKIILMQGIAGSGKSHYAQQLLNEVDAIIISSDIERKRLYGVSPLHRVAEEEKSELYSAEMNQRTYETLYDLTETIVKAGYSVIVDATFLKYQHREVFMELAEKLNADYRVVYIEPEIDLIEQNIEQRLYKNDSPSDATIDIMHRHLEQLEPPLNDEEVFKLTPHENICPETFKSWLNRPI